MADEARRGRLADVPLEERRRLEVEWQRELDDGLTRRHLAVAHERDCVAAAHFARALRAGPKLRGR